MQPDLILIPFGHGAAPGTIDTIPDTRSPGDPAQRATWDEGFPAVTMTPLGAGGIPPRGQDFNGVLNAISKHTVFSGGGGQYQWSAEYVAKNGGYPQGAVIQANDGLNAYVSLVADNTDNFNTDPASIGVSWGLYAGRDVQTQATEAVPGIAKIASQEEAEAGVNNVKFSTPLRVFQAIAQVVKQATEAAFGWAKIATQTQADTGTDDATIVTPKKLRNGVSFNFGVNGYVALPSWLGGFIFQWGSVTTSAGGAFVTWPTTFPNSVLHASATANATSITSAIVTAAPNLENGSFYTSNGAGAGIGIGIFWFLIGR